MFGKIVHNSMRGLVIAGICIAYVVTLVPPQVIGL
jgi:hypothetical protein